MKTSKQKKKAPNKKAVTKKKDRRFLAFALPLVTLLAIGLLWLFMGWESNKGEMYRAQAQQAAAAGDMDKARALAKKGEDAGEEGLQQEIEYAYGESLLRQGDFPAAREIFLNLGAYSDAPRRALECVYRQGESAYAGGNFVEAESFFREAAGYEDALVRLDDCRYQQAQSALQQGDKELALELFTGLGEYLDASQQAKALSVELTGQEDAQKGLAMSQGVTEEQWQAMEAAEALRAEQKRGRIAAGEQHGLQVTAEKTVVATGDNTCGQCNTQSWENVVAIAAGNFDSYGLTKDGKILHCGYGDMDKIASWQGISRIFAGNSVLGALRQDGSFLCTAASAQHEEWKNLSDLAVNIGWSAGLTREGTVLCTEFDLTGWKDILALYASETLLAGVRLDGTVCVQPLRPWVQELAEELEALTDVQELALAGSWGMCLHADGRVSIVGEAPSGFAQ